MAIASAPAAVEVLPETAVTASEVAREYGEGDSVVRALCGVSLEIPEGQFAAVMGPRARANRR